MIGKLNGIIDTIEENQIILDVQGVGYVVYCSNRITNMTLGISLSLLITTQIKDDSINLFGFLSKREQEVFSLLTSVQGIGGKTAIIITNKLSDHEIIMAIKQRDESSFCHVSGIGLKMAKRIVNELSNHKTIKKYSLDHSNYCEKNQNDQQSEYLLSENKINELISVLTNLGFKKNVALSVINDISNQLLTDKITLNEEDLIKMALSHLDSKNCQF